MSMPSFPPNGANMTREDALTMIIASIAMEELALSHILNAEGEKLQYILGTLPGSNSCPCPQDVLAVNKSVTALVEAVTQNQMLLKNKLDQVLEFCPRPPVPPPPCGPKPCPCPPPCPPSCPSPCKVHPCERSILQLTVQREGLLWAPGCRLAWKQRRKRGKDIRWEERAPTQIYLDPRKSYTLQYTLNVHAAAPGKGTGTILLKQSPGKTFTDALPLRFSLEPSVCGPQTLHASAVLYPCASGGCEAGLSLVLDANDALCVEGGVMNVIELP